MLGCHRRCVSFTRGVTTGYIWAVLDLAYPEILLVIEADGFASHSSAPDMRRDRRRQNELVKRGWTFYRVTWHDAINEPARVVSDVAELLERAGYPLDPLGARLSPMLSL